VTGYIRYPCNPGDRYGRLTVAGEARKGKKRAFDCVCDCGKRTCVLLSSLRAGVTRSCGCLIAEVASYRTRGKVSPLRAELAGRVFGTWHVEDVASVAKNGAVRWNCVCECGSRSVVEAAKLLGGGSRSCGCRPHSTHGATRGEQRAPEYEAWLHMRRRCNDPQDPGYQAYGGRGISVCERWLKFENFLTDMGPKPTAAHSIDRYPNNDGNYEPGNCRWATAPEQARNRRSNILITIGERTMCATDWASERGLNVGTVISRIRKGWEPVDAVTRSPVRPWRGAARTEPAVAE